MSVPQQPSVQHITSLAGLWRARDGMAMRAGRHAGSLFVRFCCRPSLGAIGSASPGRASGESAFYWSPADERRNDFGAAGCRRRHHDMTKSIKSASPPRPRKGLSYFGTHAIRMRRRKYAVGAAVGRHGVSWFPAIEYRSFQFSSSVAHA